MMPLFVQNNDGEQHSEAEVEGFRAIFQWVEDPRRSNAKKHDLIDMLVIVLLATLSGKSSCSWFARYARFVNRHAKVSPLRV